MLRDVVILVHRDGQRFATTLREYLATVPAERHADVLKVREFAHVTLSRDWELDRIADAPSAYARQDCAYCKGTGERERVSLRGGTWGERCGSCAGRGFVRIYQQEQAA